MQSCRLCPGRRVCTLQHPPITRREYAPRAVLPQSYLGHDSSSIWNGYSKFYEIINNEFYVLIGSFFGHNAQCNVHSMHTYKTKPFTTLYEPESINCTQIGLLTRAAKLAEKRGSEDQDSHDRPITRDRNDISCINTNSTQISIARTTVTACHRSQRCWFQFRKTTKCFEHVWQSIYKRKLQTSNVNQSWKSEN